MRFKLAALILIAALCTSCKKANKPAVIQVSVVSQEQTPLSNTAIVLYSSDNTIQTGNSDANGNVSFSVSEGKTYYLYSSDPGTEVENTTAAYIAIGTFTSQQQIDDSPFQGSGTQIGDNILKDINGDGAITFYDKALKVTEPTTGGTTKISLIITSVVLL